MVGGQHSVKKYIKGLGRLRMADLNVSFQGLGYSCGAKCACCKTIICISDSITWICILSTHKKLRAAAGKPSTVGGGGKGRTAGGAQKDSCKGTSLWARLLTSQEFGWASLPKILTSGLKETERVTWPSPEYPSPNPNQLYTVLPQFRVLLRWLEDLSGEGWEIGSISVHRAMGEGRPCCVQTL